jgi:hypothetical protein
MQVLINTSNKNPKDDIEMAVNNDYLIFIYIHDNIFNTSKSNYITVICSNIIKID